MRKIIHIDMDCFYAAVEQRDCPELASKPLAIGGDGDRRGVICTANYIAREFGVRAAMPTAKAYALCPQLELVAPNFEKYKAASKSIHEIFLKYTDLIEPLSLDEAYLDVSESDACQGSASWLAEAIRQQIVDTTKLTASAGIAPNKLIAKVASDWKKPNGQFVVPPSQVAAFIYDLPIAKLHGVGPVMQHKLNTIGVNTCGDLQQFSLQQLLSDFGKFGGGLFHYCRGKDDRPVVSERQRKSISVEHTYPQDLNDITELKKQLVLLFDELTKRIKRAGEPKLTKGFIKIKWHDFKITSMERAMLEFNLDFFISLFEKAHAKEEKPLRLLGLGVRLKEVTRYQQLEFDFKKDK